MCKFETDPVSIVEGIEWTRFCPQTDRDRRTEEQGETIIPPFQLRWSRGYDNMGQVTELWLSCYLVLLSIDSKTR